jgi:hypothetical protein
VCKTLLIIYDIVDINTSTSDNENQKRTLLLIIIKSSLSNADKVIFQKMQISGSELKNTRNIYAHKRTDKK